MKIVEPLRTIVVEPLELAVSDPASDPEPETVESEPEREPATVDLHAHEAGNGGQVPRKTYSRGGSLLLGKL